MLFFERRAYKLKKLKITFITKDKTECIKGMELCCFFLLSDDTIF